jgi:hypothetical protein
VSANVADTPTTTNRVEHRPAAPWWPAPLIYGTVLVACAFGAYWAMFTEFAPYDDSGYFLHSIRLFNEGQTLYDRVFTDYGPFSYQLWGALFGLAGHAVTTDAGRLAAIGIWLLTSVLLGVSAQRLTGRLAIGVSVQVLSFSMLAVLNKEPMHASGVICVLLAATVAVLAFVLPRAQRAALFALGALAAAAALTKVNVGGFYAIAAAYAVLTASPLPRRLMPLRVLAAAALVAVGPVLMLGNLTHQWVQDYAVLAVAGTLAVVLVGNDGADGGIGDPEQARRWVSWLLAGFLACAGLVIGIMLALGSSFGAFWHETVIVPTHQSAAYTAPIALSRAVILWAAAWLAAAWLLRRLRSTGGLRTGGAPLLGALGRILAALAIWFSTLTSDPIQLALPLLWVAAIPSSRDDGSARGRFVRIFIPALAVIQGLQAYPVAGTQLKFGSLLFLVCGAICFADGWADLEASGRRAGIAGVPPRRTLMAAFAALLAAGLFLGYVARPLKTWGNTYSANPRLEIPGASDLHLPAQQVATFTRITTLLRSRCHSLLTLPGLLSFNLWSGLPAPSGLTAEPFWHLLSPAQQLTALARAKAAPGLCLVRNDQVARKWGNGSLPPQVPLVAYMEREFVPIARYDGYVVAVRRSKRQA